MKKKKTLVVLLAATCCFFLVTGYNNGAGSHGWDCTGAETGLSNPQGCKASGCHSSTATTGITLTVEFDSVGVPTTHYVGGMLYTVTITGTNTTAATLPKFGLQVGCIRGSSAVTTPSNAGTWTAPFPAGTHHATPQSGNFVVDLVEHNTPNAATTGTGGTGTTYVKTFNWTAPAAGTGTVSFWAALNAVNNNGSEDSGDKWNTNHIVIDEWGNAAGIAGAAANAFSMNVFPNPVNGHASVSFTNASALTRGTIRVTDLSGKTVSETAVNDFGATTGIDCTNLSNGVYFFSLIVNNEATVTKKIVIAN
ncbi:MAG TPA: T9SS type A sorting domain-containing protein [Bacteroidia bacterium]|nr:T9SS type A sorting domain-containing protein [Bacteroidia bacterium]